MQRPVCRVPIPCEFHRRGADPSIKLPAKQIGDGFGSPDWYP
jgi:hypothetical protein